MARRVILETQYTFNPATRTIVLPRVLLRERLLLITNVTTNQVIYNFSDPTLTATAYSIAQATSPTTNATTTITLAFNTTSMLSTHALQIMVDEIAESFVPEESFIDPVGKLRVSNPQALIDTDFEYGLQPTKWEAISLLNNRPGFFVNTQAPLTITDIQVVNGSASVTVSTTTPPAVGTPVLIQDSFFGAGNGSYLVNSVSAGTSFTYTARQVYTGTTGSVYDSALTAVYVGSFYTGSQFALATQPTYSGTLVTVTTTDPHGLQIGDGIYITSSTASSNPPNGAWTVASVLSSTQFRVVVNAAPTGTISGAQVFIRPDGSSIHRAFDGGVQFSTGNPAPNLQAIRQTRRYFRYQSGKGIQISSGTILRPNINIDDLSASGTTITVTTKQAHQINPVTLPGTVVVISGANESAYNGTFTVTSVLNPFQFQYTASAIPSATPATGFPVLSISGWFAAKNRLGLYDNQNGMFFEYDGQQLFAVRRSSTDQISGQVNVTQNSATVSGATVAGAVTTKFSKQLSPGDFIVIRGMSYRVLDIASDTSMTITPPYRGPSQLGTNSVIVTRTVDVRVPQSQFNIDRLDGTGPSGLVLNLARMQMFFMDFSWYGAGTLRFGFRDTQGKVIYVHRFVNNNQNTEAWMRSGNLPARYETNTFAPVTTITSTVGSGDTTINVGNTAGFPPVGTALIANPSNHEYVNYTGLTSTSLTGVTRGRAATSLNSVATTSGSAVVTTSSSVTGIQMGMYVSGTGIPNGTFIYSITPGVVNTLILSQAATATGTITLDCQNMGNATGAVSHTFSPTAPIGVYLYAPQVAPSISHWGTSVIMDGLYDNDKSLQFIFGETSSVSVPAGQTYALMSLRCSPAVDSGITGFLGQKEIINRMQLTLQALDVLVGGSFLVTLLLNGTVVAGAGSLGTFNRIAVGTSSLAQVADHTGAVTATGGENMFGFYAVNTAGTGNFSTISADLTNLRDLGNSILGGGLSNVPGTGIYPDGPDVVTVLAQNIGASTAQIQSRLSWTEAQA